MFSDVKSIEIFIPVAKRRVTLPHYSASVPAGFPSPAEDFSDGTLDLNDLVENPSATFIVRVSGYSMSGAGIFENDLLVVDRSIKPASGQIVVAVQDGDMMVKRLKRYRGAWWLFPEAPDHPEFHAMPMQEGSEVWGVVKNVIRNLT